MVKVGRLAPPPLTLVAVLGMRGPCTFFSLDSITRSCFFSRICLAKTRISCISSSSLSSSESYSPARSFSSSSSSRCSSFYQRQHFNFHLSSLKEHAVEGLGPRSILFKEEQTHPHDVGIDVIGDVVALPHLRDLVVLLVVVHQIPVF